MQIHSKPTNRDYAKANQMGLRALSIGILGGLLLTKVNITLAVLSIALGIIGFGLDAVIRRRLTFFVKNSDAGVVFETWEAVSIGAFFLLSGVLLLVGYFT